MREYTFDCVLEEDTRLFFDDIVACLIYFDKMSFDEAFDLVNNYSLFRISKNLNMELCLHDGSFYCYRGISHPPIDWTQPEYVLEETLYLRLDYDMKYSLSLKYEKNNQSNQIYDINENIYQYLFPVLEDVKECLIYFGSKSEEEAIRLINNYDLFKTINDKNDRILTYYSPYYIATAILGIRISSIAPHFKEQEALYLEMKASGNFPPNEN